MLAGRRIGHRAGRIAFRFLAHRVSGEVRVYHTTLIAGENNDIIVGNSLTDLSIVINYDAIRGGLHETGSFEIMSPYTDYVNEFVVHEAYFDDVGMTVTAFLDGTNIVLRIAVTASSAVTTVKYGRLYNWPVIVDERGIAPTGWHIPTDDDREILTDYLGGVGVAGGKLKEAGTEHWNSPNTGATNESGFTALPSGRRSSTAVFEYINQGAYFWTSSEYYMFSMLYSNDDVARSSWAPPPKVGLSIRLVRDNLTGYTEGETVTDLDGNIYNTAQIGTQVWLVQNWACTKYANGDAIQNITQSGEWLALTTGAYCNYANDSSLAVDSTVLPGTDITFDYNLAWIRLTAGIKETGLNGLDSTFAAWWKLDESTETYYKDFLRSDAQERELLSGQIWGGRAVEFNGVNQRAAFNLATNPIPDNFKIANNSITLSCRFKMDVNPTASQILIGGYGASVFVFTDGRINAILALTSGTVTRNTLNPIVDGEWHHVFAIFDKTGWMRLYVDNILESQSDISGQTFTTTATTWNIGGAAEGFFGTKAFQLKDCRIFPTAITSDTDRDKCFNTEYLSGVAGWWTMEDNILNDAITGLFKSGAFHDISGTGNHLVHYRLTSASYVACIQKSILNQYGYGITRIYPDLIQGDGTMDLSTLWTGFTATHYTFSGGQLTFTAADNRQLINKRAISFNTSQRIRMSFDVISGTARMMPVNQGVGILSPVADYAVGHHELDFTPDYAGTGIGIYSYAAGGSYVLDNLTFKFYYEAPVMPLVTSIAPTTDIIGDALVFTGQAKYNLLKVDATTVKMPDNIAELVNPTDEVFENDWYTAGVGNEIDIADIEHQTGRQYFNGNDLIIIKENVNLTEAEDLKIQQYLKY